MRFSSKDVAFISALAVIGAGGTALHMASTQWGIGLSADSAVYIAGARGLLQGHGYSFPQGGGVWNAITLWPPFYSVVLAALGLLGLEPLEGARWLNSALLGGSTVLIGLLLRDTLKPSRLTPLMGALLFLLVDDTLSAFGWAWSDGLALFLGFAGLLLMGRYMKTRHRGALWASAGLVGMSFLSRYAGVAFVVTALAVLAIEPGRDRGPARKLGDLIGFGAGSCVLMVLWLFRNALVSGNPIGPPVLAGPITVRDWEALYEIVSLWFVPGRLPAPLRAWLMVLITAIFLVLSVTAIMARRGTGQEQDDGNPRVGKMALLFIPVYSTVILGTRTTFRYFNMAEDRYYLPVYAALVIVWLVIGRWAYNRARVALSRSGRPVIRTSGRIVLGISVALAFGVTLLFHSVQAWKWARESYSEGMGYANESWHRSQLVRYVGNLPLEAAVFSNAYDALYILTGREVYPVPQASPSLDRGRSSQDDWDDMAALLRDEGAVVVMFREATRRGLVSEATLLDEVPICPIRRVREGTVYGWCRDADGANLSPVARHGWPASNGRTRLRIGLTPLVSFPPRS